MSLADYLENKSCDFRSIFFQIIHTLAVIQNEYKGFRHNHLDFKNINVYLLKNKNVIKEYTNPKNDKKFSLDSMVELKISDFMIVVYLVIIHQTQIFHLRVKLTITLIYIIL